jgi:hypothetical protein
MDLHRRRSVLVRMAEDGRKLGTARIANSPARLPSCPCRCCPPGLPGLALSRLAGEAPAAAGLVRMLAFLAPEPVPLALLLASTQAAGLLGPEAAATVGPLLGDPVAVGDAITALRSHSLASPAGDGLVLVHRLVQAITRAQLPAETAGQWEQAAAALVEAAVPADAQLPATWPVCAVLLPHARAVLALTSGGIGRSPGTSGMAAATPRPGTCAS